MGPMTRREIVLLVSRALAVIQLITACIEISYLPGYLISLHHYTSRIDAGTAVASDYYFKSYDQVSLAMLFGRIAGLFLFTYLLLKCGPWLERFLLPNAVELEATAPPMASVEGPNRQA